MISAFPALQELKIADFVELFNGRDEPVQIMNKPTPQRLILHCDDIPTRAYGSENLLEYLISCGCDTSVRSLEVQISKRNAAQVGKFIRTLGPNLEELRLIFVRRFGYAGFDLSGWLVAFPLCDTHTDTIICRPSRAH